MNGYQYHKLSSLQSKVFKLSCSYFKNDSLFVVGKTQEQQNSFHFYFRGCGWKPKDVLWNPDDQSWIRLMDKLMCLMFGGDFMDYSLDKKKTCYVHEDCKPQFVYKRAEWLAEYDDIIGSDGMAITNTCADGKSKFDGLSYSSFAI